MHKSGLGEQSNPEWSRDSTPVVCLTERGHAFRSSQDGFFINAFLRHTEGCQVALRRGTMEHLAVERVTRGGSLVTSNTAWWTSVGMLSTATSDQCPSPGFRNRLCRQSQSCAPAQEPSRRRSPHHLASPRSTAGRGRVWVHTRSRGDCCPSSMEQRVKACCVEFALWLSTMETFRLVASVW